MDGDFPNPDFPFNEEDNPMISQMDEYREKYREASSLLKVYEGDYVPATTGSLRKVHKENAIGIDETIFEPYLDDPSEYWKIVMEHISPKPWLKYDRVLKHLANCCPNGSQSSGIAWRALSKWLIKAKVAAMHQGWKDDSEIHIDKIDPELFEAVRIAGHASLGRGTMGGTVMDKIKAGGLNWMLHNPETRVIPQCWQWVADHHKHKYHMALLTMTTRQQMGQDEETAATPVTQQDQHDQEDDSSFVHFNELAQMRVERLRNIQPDATLESSWDQFELVTPQDENAAGQVWDAAEKNFDKIMKVVNCLVRHSSSEAELAAKRAIKQALFGGPIEGRISQMLHDCLEKAGFSNEMQRNGTIKSICQKALSSETYQIYDQKQQEEVIGAYISNAYNNGTGDFGKWMQQTDDNFHNLNKQAERADDDIHSLEDQVRSLKDQVRNLAGTIRIMQAQQSAHQSSPPTRPISTRAPTFRQQSMATPTFRQRSPQGRSDSRLRFSSENARERRSRSTSRGRGIERNMFD
ncbi:hypothetical protein F5B18DRAFT_520161 [Nemania serpens]|nr:hypothetical protein F5B18DRAFT_520161 [Nemania serpens]